MHARPISGSPPPQAAATPARPRTRGFDAALARAVRAGPGAAIAKRGARPEDEAQPSTAASALAVPQVAVPQVTVPREPPRAAPPVAEARLATDAIALRDRGALELRFGGEAVRLELAPSGVELRVDAGPLAAPGVLDPGALADVLRAHGVPVAERRRGGERRDRRRR